VHGEDTGRVEGALRVPLAPSQVDDHSHAPNSDPLAGWQRLVETIAGHLQFARANQNTIATVTGSSTDA